VTLRTTVYDRCTGHAGTAALIATRCYPDQLPENVTYPALSYLLVSDDSSLYRTHDGAGGRTVSRIQFNCYDDTGDDAAALADQVWAAWDGWSSACVVGYAFVANRFKATGLMWPAAASAQRVHREIVDVMIEHSV
jgi:hypothetical protein